MNRNLKLFILAALACWTAGTTWAIDQVDGVYQIGTAQDLVDFANIVNGGTNNANAVLTADIDMTDKAWTPIGDNDHRYVGTFDGQYHTIDNLVYEGGSKIGIFGVVNGGCVIKNLIAGPGNSIKGTTMVGGIIGASDGSGWVTLENVGHEGYVEGSGNNCCAFFGVVMNGGPASRMTNCYNTGNVKAAGESAIITGWFGGHGSVEVKGFWNTGRMLAGGQNDGKDLWRNSTGITFERLFNLYDAQGATVIGDGDLASGKLAYELNGNTDAGVWRQNLEGENLDEHPTFVPTHGEVYANGALLCDGITPKEGSELTFSNHEGGTVDEHNFVDGICSVCGELNAIDGVYQLGSADALMRYSEIVRTTNGAANAVLTADIDMSGKSWTPIGQDAHDFKGHFDGQGHRIKNLTTDATKNNQALFGQAVGGAIIENVVIDASCTMQGTAFTAGILGHVWGDGVIVRNCGNEAKINGSAQNSAGIVGCSEKVVHISNCYNTGEIVGSRENAGICAWMGSNNSTIKNCWSTATNINGSALWRKSEVVGEHMYQIEGNQGTAFTAEQLASGELAYIMNEAIKENVWFQEIGTDVHPMPFGTAIVYANGLLYCDGTAKPGSVYENEQKESVRDEHNFSDWGFCTNAHDGVTCDQIQPDFMTAVNGYYEISDIKQMNWFAVWTARENASVNAKLLNDLDLTNIANFPGIGSDAKNFTGTFDGQRHIIKNLKMDWDREGVGFINRATDGAKLKNLTIASSCDIKGSKAVGGLIGGVYGSGNVYIENCGNEGSVYSSGQNAGGVVGCRFSNITLYLTNVYNVGVITGATARESGSLSGWMSNAVLKNVYSIAGYPTSENTHGFQQGNQFARGDNIQLTNCYDFGTGDWGQNNGDWGNCFKPGAGKIAEVTEAEMGRVFAGLYDAEDGNVWRMEYDGWAHPVLYDPATLVLSENVPNRFVAQEDAALTLKRTTVADTWNTFCAPFALTADQVAEVFGEGAKVAELTSADGETMNFSTVTTTEAGKAYLVKPTVAITEKALTGLNLVTTAPVADEQGGFAFTGIYEPTLIAEGDLFVAEGNKLQPSDGEGKLKAFRAYFHKVSEGARATRFVIDGSTTTGIIAIDGTVIEDGSVYTIGGQRVANPTKGLYIVNGKKVVMK